MKKTKTILLILILFISLVMKYNANAMINPWIDCDDDIYCAAQKAGFNFPLRVQNYTVRAMNDMIEIIFPLDKKRTVTVRKSQLYEGETDKNGIKDISGVYNNYPVNKSIKLQNGVIFNTRGDKKKYYVVNFAAESGYYSFYSKEGLTIKDINRFYNLLEEAEAPRYNFDGTNYTIEQLQNLRKVDDIVEPVFTQDCFPRTLQKRGVTQNCFERANLGDDTNCSASEIKMIKEYYKKGQDKDPLNNGSGNFCADES